MNCHEHFDDAFVASNAFYQEFLIPYGGRYVSGTQLFRQGDEVVIWRCVFIVQYAAQIGQVGGAQEVRDVFKSFFSQHSQSFRLDHEDLFALKGCCGDMLFAEQPVLGLVLTQVKDATRTVRHTVTSTYLLQVTF